MTKNKSLIKKKSIEEAFMIQELLVYVWLPISQTIVYGLSENIKFFIRDAHFGQ